jgi:hypothetical protein
VRHLPNVFVAASERRSEHRTGIRRRQPPPKTERKKTKAEGSRSQAQRTSVSVRADVRNASEPRNTLSPMALAYRQEKIMEIQRCE